MSAKPSNFEDLHAGFQFNFPTTLITQALRDKHVAIYGEDWTDDVVDGPRAAGVIPGPMLMSILGGQWGVHNILNVKFLKEIHIQFIKTLHVGDTIHSKAVVKEARAHKDSSKNYGYALIEQEVYNQHQELCCVRNITFLVYKRSR